MLLSHDKDVACSDTGRNFKYHKIKRCSFLRKKNQCVGKIKAARWLKKKILMISYVENGSFVMSYCLRIDVLIMSDVIITCTVKYTFACAGSHAIVH